MRQDSLTPDRHVLEIAHTTFMVSAIAAQQKTQKMRKNMECRRQLEMRKEERSLRREICEYEFELG